MMMYHLTSYLVLGFLILLPTSPTIAKTPTNCRESPRKEVRSTSCWMQETIKGQDLSQVDISLFTLTQMIKNVDGIDPLMKPQLEDILDRLLQFPRHLRTGVVFRFDFDAGLQRANTDCNIYRRQSRGKLDESQTIYSLGPPPCDNKAISLFLIFLEALDGRYTSVAPPFEKYYFPGYPVTQLAKKYERTPYSNLWFGISLHRIPVSMIPKALARFKPVLIPVRSYTTGKGDSLTHIARRIKSKKEDWKALWAANIDFLYDPYKLKEGERISVPAVSNTWKKIVPSPSERNQDIAVKVYGSPAYTGMVSAIRHKGALPGEPDSFYLPLFDLSKVIGFAYFGASKPK